MKTRFNLIVLLLVLSLNLVSAAPPVTTVQQFPEGYSITEQQYHVFKFGEPLRYGFLLENATDGLVVNDSAINYCRLVVSNNQGFNTQAIEIFYNDTYRLWGIELNETQVLEIFPEVGFYNYLISCQDDFGGVLTGIFEVTPNGFSLEISNAILYGVIIIIMFIILLFIIYICITTYDKRIRFSCLAIGYIVNHVFFLILWKTFDSFLYLIPFIGTFFRVFYEIFTIGYFIFFPVLFFFMLMNHFNEKKFGRLRQMGYSDDDIKFHQRRNKR